MIQLPARPATGEVGDREAVLLEDALGEIAAQANRAIRDVALGLVELAETGAQVSEADVHCAGNRAGFVLHRFADVDELRIFRQRLGAHDIAFTGQHVLGDKPEEVHGILRRAVRRRIGEFKFPELRRLELQAHCRRNRVDALVDAFHADDLRTVDRAVRAEEKLHRHSLRARIISRRG